MLRITRVKNSGSQATIRFEGKILEPWIGEIRRVCEEVEVPPSHCALDLSRVSFVDAAGAQLLLSLKRQGFQLIGCSGFIREMLVTPSTGRLGT